MTFARRGHIPPTVLGARRRGLGWTLTGAAGVLAAAAALGAAVFVSTARAETASAFSRLIWFTQQSLRSRDDALALLGFLGLTGGAVTVIVVAAAQLLSARRS